MRHIEIYTTRNCPYCVQARALLTANGLTWSGVDVGFSSARVAEMVARSGRRTVPRIFIDNEGIGGFEELAALHRDGRLN